MKLPKNILAKVANAVMFVLGLVKLNTPNRIVIALSPLFTAAAGAVMVLVAHYLPAIGSQFSTTDLTGLFIAGATFAATKVLMWLHGWQQAEGHAVAQAALSRPIVAPVVPFQVPDGYKLVLSEDATPADVIAKTLGVQAEPPTPLPAPVQDVGQI